MHGKDCIIESTVAFCGDERKLSIGDRVLIGSYCNLRFVEHRIIICDNVLIAQLVSIIADNHNYQDVATPILDQGTHGGDIVIEENAWIGCNSVILDGVRIGTGSVVAAGSIVTRDVPAYHVVAGNPARPLKKYCFQRKRWIRPNPLAWTLSGLSRLVRR